MASEGSLKLDGSPELLSEIQTMGWDRLLQTWGRLLDTYDNLKPYYEGPHETPRDVAYWYGERTLTGLLAAAAWQVPGGWSLEEFLDAKDPKDEEAAKTLTRGGRSDLWLGLGKHEFTIEAKFVRREGSSPETVERIIQKKLAEADKQVRRLHHDYLFGYPMAVVFAVPGFKDTGSVSEPKIKRYFSDIATTLAKANDRIFWATYLPYGGGKKLPCDDGWVYPGVMFIGRYRTGEQGWPQWSQERQQWGFPAGS